MQIHHVDAVKQIGAEGAVDDLFFQFSIGGADHADFDFLVFLRADAAELAILQKLQQLRLQAHVEFGNFIEKQRAAMRHFDAARLGAVGAGEGSFFVAEQFAFEKRAGNRGTIHLHPWTGLPWRSAVNHARNDVFAGAALSVDQHGDVGARDFCQPFAKSPHGFGAPKTTDSGGISPRGWIRELTGFEVLISRSRLLQHGLRAGVHPENQTQGRGHIFCSG